MAAAETARLIASLELQDKNFTRGLKNVERGVGRVDKKLGAFSGFVNRNMGRAIDSIALRFTTAITSGLSDLAELESATTSVTGAIETVGKGWSVTGEEIATWANEIEANTEAAFDDKAIVASAATLIRYGKVSEGNLRPAMEVMTDLAARTGDTESAAVLLGKALANPAKAAGKLQRYGINLTKAQEKQIKAMVKAGDVAGAQTVLLDILAETTKGAAAASSGPYADALHQFADATEDARKALAVGFLPVIQKVAKLLSTELAKPGTINALKSFGQSLGGVFDEIVEAARKIPWSTIGESLRLAGAGAKIVLDAFLGLPPWIQTAVLTGWGLNKLSGGLLGDIASGLIKGVLGINAGVVNIKAASVVGGGGGAPVPGGKGGGVVGKIGNAVKILGAVTIAGASIVALAETIKGFMQTVGESQGALLERVESTSKQGFKETIANLKGTSAKLAGLQGLDRLLAEGFGGSEITKNFEMAAERIINNEKLSRADTVTALQALKTAQEQAESMNLETPELNAAIGILERRLENWPPKTERTRTPSKPLDKVDPKNKVDFSPVVSNLEQSKVVLSGIKTGVTTQTAELGNIKNATVTLSTDISQSAAAQTVALSGVKTGITTLGTSISTQSATQTAELGNIKNGLATLKTADASQLTALGTINTTTAGTTTAIGSLAATTTTTVNGVTSAVNTVGAAQRVATAAHIAATTTGNMLSVVQSAQQVMAAVGTTNAARTAGSVTAAATRSVPPPIVGAVHAIGSQISATIWAARPIIQPTTIIERHTVSERGGSTSDSRTRSGP